MICFNSIEIILFSAGCSRGYTNFINFTFVIG